MTFNEKDQLEELNLLPIWEFRAPSVSEPKVSNYSEDLFFVTTLNVNAKNIYFIFDVDHDDKQSQNLMNSINQFLKCILFHSTVGYLQMCHFLWFEKHHDILLVHSFFPLQGIDHNKFLFQFFLPLT